MAKKMTIGAAIALDGEKEYRQALSGITSDQKVLTSEMKLSRATFADNANSIEALSSKGDILNKQLEKQKEKVEALKHALENSKNQYGENDTKTDAWKTSLNNAEAELSKIDNELKTNSKYLDEAKASTEGTAKSIDEFGKEVKDAGDNTLKTGDIIKANLISAAIIEGVKALGSAMKSVGETTVGLVEDTAAYADDMLTMSVQTGVSTDKLQAYNYMAELTDTSLETMTKSMAKNIKSMASAQDGSEKYKEAYKQLNVAFEDGNGKLRDSESVYWDVIDALGGMSDETERDALSMQLFGKSAQELNPLIAQGSKGVKALTDEAVSMGAVLSTDTLNALGGTDDAIQRMNQTVEIAKRKFGAEMAPAVTSSIEKISAKISDMDDELADLAGGALTAVTDGFIWMIDNSDLIAAGLTGIGTAMTVQAGVTAVSAAVQGYKDFKVALEGATVAEAMFNAVANANPIGLVATAIVGLGAAMVTYTAIHKNTTSEFAKMEEKIKDVRAENNKFAKEIKTSEVNFSSNAAEAERNCEAVQVLSDRLYALADKEKKSNSEKLEMKALVGQLNESIPNLNLVLDEQTYVLNKQRPSVDSLIQSMKEKTRLQVYEERYLELAKQQAEAQERLARAEELRNEIKKKYKEAEKTQEKIESDFDTGNTNQDIRFSMDTTENIIKFKAALKEAEDGVESANDNLNKCNGKFNELGEQMKKSSETTKDYAKTAEKANSQVSVALSEAETAYKEAKKTALDSIKSQIDIFDKFSKASKVSKDTLLKNLESQVKGVAEWADNLQSLSKRGIDEGLLSELKKMGPGAAAQIATLNSMSNKELKNYSNMWDRLGKETVKGAEITASDTKAAYDKAFKEQAKAAASAGKSNMDSYSTGIKSKAGSIGDAISGTINKSISQTKADVHSGFFSVGAYSGDGVIEGIKSKKAALDMAARDFAKVSLFSMHYELEMKSPSKRMKREVGENIALGVIEGINEKKGAAKKSSQELAEEILSAAKTKLDNYKVYKDLTVQEEIDFWNQIRKECKKGTQARIDADKEYYTAKEKYKTNQKELLESQKTAEAKYKDDCKKINSELIADVQATTKTYNDAVASRTQAIVDSFGLFDSFAVEKGVTGQQLINNLQSQVVGIAEWSENLNKLKERGIGKGLMEELQSMGVKSSAEIAALLTLTDQQLNGYVTLWEQKTALAKKQAVSELTGLKGETTKKINELNSQANADLKSYYNTYVKAMKDLGVAIKEPVKQVKATIGSDGEAIVKNVTSAIKKEAKSKDSKDILDSAKDAIKSPFQSMHADGKSIGTNLATGIISGLTSQNKELTKAAQEVVKTTLETMKKAGDINSPSRKTAELIGKPLAQGIAVGFNDTMSWVSKEMESSIPMNFNTDAKMGGAGFNAGMLNDGEFLLTAITDILTSTLGKLKLTTTSETPVFWDSEQVATIVTRAQLEHDRRFEFGGG